MTSNECKHDKTKNSAAEEAAQKAKDATMASIMQLVDDEAAKNGCIPYGFVTHVINEFKIIQPYLTRDMINHYRKNRKQSAHATSDLTGLDGNNAAEAGSTTSPMGVSNNLLP